MTSYPATSAPIGPTRAKEEPPRRALFQKPFLLHFLALCFAVATITYSAAWVYSQRFQAQVQIGFDNLFTRGKGEFLRGVRGDSPAERAGLKAGDLIIAINGDSVAHSEAPFFKTWADSSPGDTVDLTVSRPGIAAPFVVRAVFRDASNGGSSFQRALFRIASYAYPVWFLAVGLTVLLSRLSDWNAWLLALLFAAFITVPNFSTSFESHGALRTFAFGYRALFGSLIGALFYFFFAMFPRRSPLDRKLPWIKYLLIGLGLSFAIPGLQAGDSRPWPLPATILSPPTGNQIRLVCTYASMLLGLVALCWNAATLRTPEARRKLRVVFWGTIVGVSPAVIVKGVQDFAGVQLPFWVGIVLMLALLLFPASFAYAVVKHNVLEIPVLLRRSARYLLVRRGLVLLVLILAGSAIALFTLGVTRIWALDTRLGMALGMGVGIVLAWISTPTLKRTTERVDRAFFRGAYDARLILQDLAERVRATRSRHELADLLQENIQRALHPSFIVSYVLSADGRLSAQYGNVPADLQQIDPGAPELQELAKEAQPKEVVLFEQAPLLAPLHPECLVPVVGRSSQLLALGVLGPRLSEEPYSRDDLRLLGSVASHAGIALENIALAEQMAERMEAERREARDMEIARAVQRKLFPQEAPALCTLEYSGACVQARAVGGDYYDFLDLGPGRVAFVLADVAGKGISGALLMANLQANLRSQYALAIEDLPGLLSSVNRLFYLNTDPEHYATLFLGVYDDKTHSLRYVNCGHNPPLLLRFSGNVERLGATATVLGLFSDWQCEVEQVLLSPCDTFVIYSDGVTEAADDNGQEFGENRLVQTVRESALLPVETVVQNLRTILAEFSRGKQLDDITLIVGRVIQ